MSFSEHISVIVPVYHEGDLSHWLHHLIQSQNHPDFEILVVDGDPLGSSLSSLGNLGRPKVHVLIAPRPGRAAQMNCGAKQAKGDILLFLHADTLLPSGALRAVAQVLRMEPDLAGGAFDLGIASERPVYRLIERVSSWRSRLSRIPFGDQALFVRRTVFESLGGFAFLPLMEDIHWGQSLKRNGQRIHIFPERVQTSARRWEQEGWLYTTLRNWSLQVQFYAGVPAEKWVRYDAQTDS